MEQNKRKKLCPNCNGEMDLEVIVCPFCRFDLSSTPLNDTAYAHYKPSRSLSPEETLTSLYPPPYQPKGMSGNKEAVLEDVIDEEAVEKKLSFSPVWPTLLFSIGINLLLFSLFLLFFSKNGQLLLKWDSRFWILYALLSAPLLFFGYRGLSKIMKDI